MAVYPKGLATIDSMLWKFRREVAENYLHVLASFDLGIASRIFLHLVCTFSLRTIIRDPIAGSSSSLAHTASFRMNLYCLDTDAFVVLELIGTDQNWSLRLWSTRPFRIMLLARLRDADEIPGRGSWLYIF